MINNIIRNPLVKTIGIVLVLYFGLFTNKEDPGSLGNRMAPKKIKENVNEAWEQGKFIATNVKKAQELAKTTDKKPETLSSLDKVIAEDLNKGVGEKSLTCGDSAIISYGLYNLDGHQLDFIVAEKFTIGERKNWLIEKNLIGMKIDGARIIGVPQDFITDDIKLAQLLKLGKTDLKYHVSLKDIVPTPPKSKISCN